MKVLYAIQGTGNGHLSRAREILPRLEKKAEVDILLSGTQVDMSIPQAVKYQFHGFSFIFGKRGGVDHLETWKQMDLGQFRKDLLSLPLHDYDLIINDFEPLSAWACRYRKKKCVALSHQAAFISDQVPKPRSFDWGKFILRNYAPSNTYFGFHFEKYAENIFTPVIRSEVRELSVPQLAHYTVYLPAFDDQHIIALLKHFPDVTWEVFSKHNKQAYKQGNIWIRPIDNQAYLTSLGGCKGLITGGGFEGPAEALYLGKKLLVIPMKYQYEQQCNAVALRDLGVSVIWASSLNWVTQIARFLEDPKIVQLSFPDETDQILDRVLQSSV
ncbi:MAG: glycosyl transferase [Pedobacter sp.]|nr:MAG: glycosyl transferase [Pedobacter sp.]